MILYPNAKINLGLNVVSKRADGYHNLETVFLPVALSDILQIEKADDDQLHFSYGDGIELDCDMEDNLIVRTFRLFQKNHLTGGLNIRFEKHIPFGAGLGGGSSDSAHAALAINELFSLGLSKEQLKKEVSKLGADCAFFIENTPCFAQGIGDILLPIELSLKGYTLVLVKPDSAVSTKEAYAGITPVQPERSIREIITLPVEEWRGTLVNDFEKTVFRTHPEIAAIKQQLYDMGAAYASMSGSGATVYGIFKTDTDHKSASAINRLINPQNRPFVFIQHFS